MHCWLWAQGTKEPSGRKGNQTLMWTLFLFWLTCTKTCLMDWCCSSWGPLEGKNCKGPKGKLSGAEGGVWTGDSGLALGPLEAHGTGSSGRARVTGKVLVLIEFWVKVKSSTTKSLVWCTATVCSGLWNTRAHGSSGQKWQLCGFPRTHGSYKCGPILDWSDFSFSFSLVFGSRTDHRVFEQTLG